LVARWTPNLKDGFKKETKHETLADILESIEELRYYREHFIKCPSL
jgi:oligoribonuclease